MAVMKNSATQHLINQIKSALAVGKIATVDTALNKNSTNPVQNKAIAEALEDNDYKPIVYKVTNITGGGVSYAIADNPIILTNPNVTTRANITANSDADVSLGYLPTDLVPYDARFNDLTVFATMIDTYEQASQDYGLIMRGVYLERDTSTEQIRIKATIRNTSSEDASNVALAFNVMVVKATEVVS